jgi:hypothetical protein
VLVFDVDGATTAPSKAGAGQAAPHRQRERLAFVRSRDPSRRLLANLSSVMICALSPPGERDGEWGFL